MVSNKFSLEWPKRSGIMREYPEIDRAGWFEIELARKKILKGSRVSSTGCCLPSNFNRNR